MTERLKLVESFRQSVSTLVQQTGFLFSAVERGSYDADERETLLTELGKAAAEVRQAVDGGVDALIRPTTGTRPGEWTSDLLRLIAAVCDDLTTLARNWFAAAGADDIDSLLQRKQREAEYRPILERTRQRLLELQAKSDYLTNFDTSVVESDGVKSETSGGRWVWHKFPLKTPRKRQYLSREQFDALRAIVLPDPLYRLRSLAEKERPKLPELPFQLVVKPGETIPVAVESMRRTRVSKLYTGEPIGEPQLVESAVAFYAPTDRELALMESWSYDERNPDWNRFADELAKLLLVVGSAPPQNWRVSPEWQNRTASWLVDLMADLKRQTGAETLPKSQRELADMLSDFWDNPANAGINDDISRDISLVILKLSESWESFDSGQIETSTSSALGLLVRFGLVEQRYRCRCEAFGTGETIELFVCRSGDVVQTEIEAEVISKLPVAWFDGNGDLRRKVRFHHETNRGEIRLTSPGITARHWFQVGKAASVLRNVRGLVGTPPQGYAVAEIIPSVASSIPPGRSQSPGSVQAAKPTVKVVTAQHPLTDGPFGLDGFCWNTVERRGLEAVPWRLVAFLWPKTDRAASFDELAEPVWKDREQYVTADMVSSARKKANKFFVKGAFPFQIKTSPKGRRAELIQLADSIEG